MIDLKTRAVAELQIKKKSCQTLGPASKRVLPDLLLFRNFLIFHFQYSMIKGTILNKGNNKITEQSYKGKVKTHKYINRQNQSTTGKL